MPQCRASIARQSWQLPAPPAAPPAPVPLAPPEPSCVVALLLPPEAIAAPPRPASASVLSVALTPPQALMAQAARIGLDRRQSWRRAGPVIARNVAHSASSPPGASASVLLYGDNRLMASRASRPPPTNSVRASRSSVVPVTAAALPTMHTAARHTGQGIGTRGIPRGGIARAVAAREPIERTSIASDRF
jgi:hypothetical protein